MGSMDTGGDGTVDRDEFINALTPFGLKRGRSRATTKLTKKPSSLQLNQGKRGSAAARTESFEDRQARLMHLSSPHHGSDGGSSTSRIESLEKELARLKMPSAKREREMQKTIKDLKGRTGRDKTEAAAKAKDHEIQRMRKKLSHAETTARMSSEA